MPLTIVVTDIQGSTELWERLGQAFAPALALHDRLIREACAAFHGREIRSEGDSFTIGFVRAEDAVGFALRAQESLHAASWPPTCGEVFVRIGVHSGAGDEGGLAASARRIAGAAHGGQVLLSQSVREEAARVPGAVFSDLGDHRVRGLERPERLWQALPSVLASREFPPPLTLTAVPTNLPVQSTAFIGRDPELARLSQLLVQGPSNLVTLTGPGGTGKTRLAARVGSELLGSFAGGVWLADLTEAKDETDVAETVARVFGAPLSGQRSPSEVVAGVFDYRQPLLLILDNFEQVVSHAEATVGLWRRRAPHIRFLVTSRTVLNLQGETEVPLETLPCPTRGDPHPETFDAVRLFVDRAREADPSFQLTDRNSSEVTDLCLALEGMPLALELAAARVRILRPAQMLARLSQKFSILHSTRKDVNARQQTLWNAIDWSYQLLSPAQRSAFRQLSIFRGGFFLEAAEEVLDFAGMPDAPVAMDVVQELRDRSLLVTTDLKYGKRFRMYVPIREFAEKRLAEEETPAGREALVKRFVAHMDGYAALWHERQVGRDVIEAASRLSVEAENILHAQEATQESPRAVRMLVSLREYLIQREPAAALLRRIERTAALPMSPADACRIAMTRAEVLRADGQMDRAHAEAAKARTLAESVGDPALIAESALVQGDLREDDPTVAIPILDRAADVARNAGNLILLARIMGSRASAHRESGNIAEARRDYDEEEKLCRRLDHRAGLARNLGNRAVLHKDLHEMDAALECEAQSEALFQELGQLLNVAKLKTNRALTYINREKYEEGEQLVREAMRIHQDIGFRPGIANCKGNLATAAKNLGRKGEAEALYQEAEAMYRQLGDARGETRNAGNRAGLLLEKGDVEGAKAILIRAEASARAAGLRRDAALWLRNVASCLFAQTRVAEALEMILRARSELEAVGGGRTPEQFSMVASIAHYRSLLGDAEGARAAAREALEIAAIVGITESSARADDLAHARSIAGVSSPAVGSKEPRET